MIDLDQYFQRIGYAGVATCELATLRSIVLAHATSIPFECLDPLAGLAVSIEIDAIFEKLVCRRRGGYCFEQNALLAAVLRRVGFEVDELSARVWYNTPAGTTPPRTHVFLAVTVDGIRWLADCGLGGSTPCGLMELDRIGVDQPLLGETRRIVRIDGRLVPTFMHQVRHGDAWSDIYEFTGEAMPKSDQAMANWWAGSHPESKFRKNLIVAVLNRDGTRYALVNKEFVHRRSSEVLERIEIGNLDHLLDLLCERFGLELPKPDAAAFLSGGILPQD
ncbi:MAG TPA: arylamine N-acetyltransferase [Planctomycetaceae bacterium]|nr:arylamine N-acetyltransferase [Planctomycetaceae bacterium]